MTALLPELCGGHIWSQATTAERILMDGHVDEAIGLLNARVSSHGTDGQAYLLLCRAYYSEQQVDDALRACQNAVKLTPNSSEAQDWMGRVYGNRAAHAGPFSGLKLAHEVHDAFEAAVRLDPRSAAAANDLAEYYISAPAIVGGGLDKADALATSIEPDLPQAAHRIRALAAEKRKDYAGAEREFQAEVAVAHRPDALVDLGGFYKRRSQSAKAVAAFEEAIAADRAKSAATVDAASYLMDMHTAPEVSRKALTAYLAGGGKSDAAPVIRVHVLLGRLAAGSGDTARAKIEFNMALGLAAKYAEAQRELQKLR
jgi:tetratricopeptide (TPR) repeat protein